MSLDVSLSSKPLSKKTAHEIARQVSAQGPLGIVACTSWFSLTCRRFTIPEVHDMLADNADPNAEVWCFEPSRLAELAEVVRLFAAEIGTGFHFRVAWAGDCGAEPKQVTLAELLEAILGGEIRNHVEYRVEPEKV